MESPDKLHDGGYPKFEWKSGDVINDVYQNTKLDW